MIFFFSSFLLNLNLNLKYQFVHLKECFIEPKALFCNFIEDDSLDEPGT